MIPASSVVSSARYRLREAMRISIALCWFVVPARAQERSFSHEYPVNGVWVAADDRTPGSKGGACFTLKLLGIDSVMDGSLPPVLIFSDGKRVEARSGYHFEESIKSVKALADDAFRIAELPSKRSKWFPWSRKQSRSLKIIDPVTIEFGDGQKTTRFVKCSAKNSLL